MPHSFPLLKQIAHRARYSPDSLAIFDTINNQSYSYSQLFSDIISYSNTIEAAYGASDLQDARVGILAQKGYPIVVALLATFASGGLALPLLPSLPLPEHNYMVQNAEVSLILYDDDCAKRGAELLKELPAASCKELKIPALFEATSGEFSIKDTLGDGRKAMMLYTSGTTGRPKGVVTRHSALAAQVSSIVEFWRWQDDDLLLHILPLNHLHGIVVAILTSLWAGAAVELWSKLDAEKVWRRWINQEKNPQITMMFGVPTVYSRLLSAYEGFSPDEQRTASKASARLRLQVSGSAPLPESLKKRWDGGIGGGQVLLERYGMTETGILLSTGFEIEKRIGGFVGNPLPGVQVRLWNSDHNKLIEAEDIEGEIQVRGPGIFNEYYGLPEATTKEFEDGNWFKTGDVGLRSKQHRGMYKVLGRKSVDIIKSGGEKISALDIERELLELDYISDAAVVGIPDEDWGQVIGAIVVSKNKDLTLEKVRNDLRTKIAAYKLPRAMKLYPDIPRNAMGKIQKKELVLDAFGDNKKVE